MNALKSFLLCLGVAACSHDRPPETAYDSQPTSEPQPTTEPAATARSADEGLTPASTTGERRAVRDGDVTPAGTSADRDASGAAAANVPGTGTPNDGTAATAVPDNTKRNERDRDDAALTPGDQGNGEQDLRITQQIRQAVMDDKSLSFTAKNVKIITVNGKVTLRGPVNSTQERSAIEAAARKVAGVSQVDSQLEVKK
jgi:hyperosmotically inducible protein